MATTTRSAGNRESAPTKAAPRRPAPTKAERPGRPPRRRANTRLLYDVLGVSLVTAALILLATLLWPAARPGENVFGSAVIAGMRLIVGVGVWAFPVVLLVCGLLLAVGRSRSWDNVGGAVFAYLVYISWWHLGHAPPAGHFALDNLLNYGGYVGAGLSWCLRTAVGTVGGHIFFFALSLVALLYLTDIPLPALLGPIDRLLGRGAEAGRKAARSGLETARVRIAQRRENRLTPGTVDTGTADTVADKPDNGRFGRRLFVRRTPEPGETDAPQAGTPKGKPLSRPGLFSFRRREQPPLPGMEELSAPETDEPEEEPIAPVLIATTEAIQPSAPPAPRGPDPNAPALEAVRKFVLPSMQLLKPGSPAPKESGESEERREILLQTLEDFGVGADVANIAHGPTITRYEVELDRGIKVSKIVSLADNLAMALAAIDVRIEAPIPGKSAIGIEVPNETRQTVTLRDVIDRPEFLNSPSKLTFALGKDVTGTCRYADLAKMPHLLIGGSTGSGKSVGLNTLICSLLYRCTPRELKFLMIDPKKVELSLYEGIPHLAAPVITNVKQAPSVFKQALKEMETRYDRFAKMQTRNLEGYNSKVPEDERLPYWVIVVDELADLMMTSGPEIETAICRLAQLARATGIHLVIATQRPSVNVITGTIKANISSRIAFAVNSAVDSRTILDSVGADRLIGRGDMLFMPMDATKPMRIQGCFVSEQETESLVEYLKSQAQPSFEVLPSSLSLSDGDNDSGEEAAEDELFESAVKLVVSGGSASTSMLQRRFKIGYTRAARLVDLMEQRGIVGPLDGAKPREILISREQADAMFAPPGTD
ncbi:MAG: DNA translocase FtsK [Capsulimonadales bacterium]|nr:DNA translocase FtsK [Capsulimonadales bacterium]